MSYREPPPVEPCIYRRAGGGFRVRVRMPGGVASGKAATLAEARALREQFRAQNKSGGAAPKVPKHPRWLCTCVTVNGHTETREYHAPNAGAAVNIALNSARIVRVLRAVPAVS